MPDPQLLAYATYALVAATITIWLARTLSRNGAVFLEQVFPDDPRLAGAINQLLVVGFYLGNFGWSMLMLRGEHQPTPVAAFEMLASKLGLLMLILAGMHFTNLFVFHRIRRHVLLGRALPPVPHQGMLPMTHHAYQPQ